jgi:hypothetical protein
MVIAVLNTIEVLTLAVVNMDNTEKNQKGFWHKQWKNSMPFFVGKNRNEFIKKYGIKIFYFRLLLWVIVLGSLTYFPFTIFLLVLIIAAIVERLLLKGSQNG